MKHKCGHFIWKAILTSAIFLALIIQNAQAVDCTTRMLVVYTEAAQAKSSFIISDINTAIAQLNTSFKNSNIRHKVEIGGVFFVNYIEKYEENFSSHLNNLMTQGNGKLDEIAQLKASLGGIDIVALIVADDRSCGLSGDPLDPAAAFCVVNYACLLENYSLARQYGYMNGCGNHETQSGRTGEAEYARGYIYDDPDDEKPSFTTIMGYTDEAISSTSDDFSLIPFWSNPAVSHNDDAIGDDLHNNAKTLNDKAEVMANLEEVPNVVTINVEEDMEPADEFHAEALEEIVVETLRVKRKALEQPEPDTIKAKKIRVTDAIFKGNWKLIGHSPDACAAEQ